MNRTPSHRLLASLVVCSAGCAAEPDLRTSLDTSGPPEVLTVAVPSEQAEGERATYCAGHAGARVSELYCPTEGMVTDVVPLGWHVRIVFAELLAPAAAEELADEDGDGVAEGHIRDTRPVILRCGASEVAYDGYYDPAGNRFTTPVGPALVVQASDFAGTGADCSVELTDRLTDKDGQAIPASERGPFAFRTAALRTVATVPEDGATGVAADVSPSFAFNAPLDAASLDASDVQLLAGTEPVPAVAALAEDGVSLTITPTAGSLLPGTTYTAAIAAGATITDVLGGAFDPGAAILSFSFTTAPAPGT
jgi:hypothetical protein